MERNLIDCVNNQSNLQGKKYWKASEIHNLIDENKKDIAFITGNGVNLYFADDIYSKENKRANIKSWKDLLLSLWNKDNKVIEEEKIREIPSGLSYTESFDLLDLKRTLPRQLRSEDITPQMVSRIFAGITPNVKTDVTNEMENWKGGHKVEKFVRAIKKLETPFLTTNFDEVLPSSLNLKETTTTRLPQKCTSNSKRFRWNYYYSDQGSLELPTSGFGIWHINGSVCHPESISFGLCDYMFNVTIARNMIQGIDKPDTFSGKHTSYWPGCNTWLHIIFNKSLFIFGLSLGENETFLRWLLIQRAKYFALYRTSDTDHQGWYVADPKDISEGKRFFLESAGFEIINIKKYKTIYEDVWK
ncbi:MAG: SIR2 family protein [Prevotella sp.]|jgi:hypothetical protein|nr:hypothetical protein [Prevotella sp.]MCH4183625.1 SIR2 family protein [Prevotella sp.]MCH4212307.1 SIR2 family protein [Prevotella sp.]MCH4240321.1 SIR2 family protein [Prevotella sp.]